MYVHSNSKYLLNCRMQILAAPVMKQQNPQSILGVMNFFSTVEVHYNMSTLNRVTHFHRFLAVPCNSVLVIILPSKYKMNHKFYRRILWKYLSLLQWIIPLQRYQTVPSPLPALHPLVCRPLRSPGLSQQLPTTWARQPLAFNPQYPAASSLLDKQLQCCTDGRTHLETQQIAVLT